MGRSPLSPPSSVSGPDAPLAGIHLTPLLLRPLRSREGLGPAQSPSPSCPLPHLLPPRPGPALSLQAPGSSRCLNSRPDCAAADSPRLVSELRWGAPLLSVTPSTHSYCLKKTRKAGLPHPGFPDLLKGRLPGLRLRPNGSSPAAGKGLGTRGPWAWLGRAAPAPCPRMCFSPTPTIRLLKLREVKPPE